MFNWLETALDYGVSEDEFWDMSLSEFLRCIESKRRAERLRLQERAYMDWRLANLVALSVSRLYSASATYPDCEDYYSALFDDEQKKIVEEKKWERKQELSVLRFKQFADSYNKRFKEVQND